jgi:hypothetical protein
MTVGRIPNIEGGIQPTLLTTAGDIMYASSASNPARLGIGTAGQVLTVNSGATAPEWAAASGGSNWTLLNAGGTTLTGAQTITISGISGKSKIMIFVSGAGSASNSSDISVRLNTDTAGNYYYFGNEISAAASYDFSNFDAFTFTAETFIRLGRSSSNSGTSNGYCLLDGCNASGVKTFQVVGGGSAASSGDRYNSFGGYYNSATTISSVSMFSSSGNFDAGTVYVYTSA